MGLLTAMASLARFLGPLVFSFQVDIQRGLFVFLPMSMFLLVSVVLPFATCGREYLQIRS